MKSSIILAAWVCLLLLATVQAQAQTLETTAEQPAIIQPAEPLTVQPPKFPSVQLPEPLTIQPPTFEPPVAVISHTFPEFSIPLEPKRPGPYEPSEGVDLHVYFTDASYDSQAQQLTFTFELANWGDTDCHNAFAYTAKPGYFINQPLPRDAFDGPGHWEQYFKWFTAPPPEEASAPISLAAGEARSHTVTYDMSDPAVWEARGVTVGVWRVDAAWYPPLGTFADSAWLAIRPADFDYRAVLVGRRGEPEEYRELGILRVKLAEFQNMGARSYQLLGTTIRHAFYSKRIDPQRLLANPGAYEQYRIQIAEPYLEYRKYDDHDTLIAMGVGDYLGPGEVFPYYHQVRDEDWEMTQTVRVWIEKYDLDRWSKYQYLTPVAYPK